MRFKARQRGSESISVLVFLLVLALPVTMGAVAMMDVLFLATMAYEERLVGELTASAGIEDALYKLARQPEFYEDLTSLSPSASFSTSVNGRSANVVVTEVFISDPLQGQGLDVRKTVNPNNAFPNTLSTFTYNINIKNIENGVNRLKRVHDILPPGLAYVSGSTTGVTTMSPFHRQ